MAITNPTKYVSVRRLGVFESQLAAKYQTQAISAITGLEAETVEGALAELLGKITALPSAIVPKGTKAFAGLDPTTDLVADNVGFMWNISDAFTTTADFVEGTGHSIPAGANVYVANPSNGVYKYDIFQGMYDLSDYALKSEMSITDGTGDDADKTTIQLKSGLSKAVLIAHQDISGKAEKDTDAVEGNFAAFDANGNPVDSGKKDSDYATAAQGAKADTAVQSVKTINGSAMTGEGNVVLPAELDANPMALTAEQIAALRVNDVVNKTDGNAKYAYTVVYKDDTAHEIALRYCDVHTVEEIYYEQDGSGNWKAAIKETTDLDAINSKLDGLNECSDADIASIFA